MSPSYAQIASSNLTLNLILWSMISHRMFRKCLPIQIVLCLRIIDQWHRVFLIDSGSTTFSYNMLKSVTPASHFNLIFPITQCPIMTPFMFLGSFSSNSGKYQI